MYRRAMAWTALALLLGPPGVRILGSATPKSSVASLGTVASIFEPVPRNESSFGAQFNLTDPKQMCGASFDTAVQAVEVWHRTGAGQFLDDWVQKHGDTFPNGTGTGHNWLDHMLRDVFDVDGAMDCTSMSEGGCSLQPTLCHELVAKGKGSMYWVLKGVSMMNMVVSTLHEQAQSTAILESLDISGILHDFGLKSLPQKPKPAFFRVLNACVYMVCTSLPALLTLFPELKFGTILSVDVWIWWASAAIGVITLPTDPMSSIGAKGTKPPSVPFIDLQTGLKEYFTATESTLQQLLIDALGYGDQRRLASDLHSEKEIYKTPTGRFFADGKWLIKDVGVHLNPIMKATTRAIQQHMCLDAITQEYEGWVTLWDDVKSREQCDWYRNEYNYTTATWLNETQTQMGFPKCVAFFGQSLRWGRVFINGTNLPRTPTYNIKLQWKYGISDWAGVFTNAIDCALNSKDKEVVPDLLIGGPYGRCFWNLHVWQGEWRADKSKWSGKGLEYQSEPGPSKLGGDRFTPNSAG